MVAFKRCSGGMDERSEPEPEGGETSFDGIDHGEVTVEPGKAPFHDGSDATKRMGGGDKVVERFPIQHSCLSFGPSARVHRSTPTCLECSAPSTPCRSHSQVLFNTLLDHEVNVQSMKTLLDRSYRREALN